MALEVIATNGQSIELSPIFAWLETKQLWCITFGNLCPKLLNNKCKDFLILLSAIGITKLTLLVNSYSFSLPKYGYLYPYFSYHYY